MSTTTTTTTTTEVERRSAAGATPVTMRGGSFLEERGLPPLPPTEFEPEDGVGGRGGVRRLHVDTALLRPSSSAMAVKGEDASFVVVDVLAADAVPPRPSPFGSASLPSEEEPTTPKPVSETPIIGRRRPSLDSYTQLVLLWEYMNRVMSHASTFQGLLMFFMILWALFVYLYVSTASRLKDQLIADGVFIGNLDSKCPQDYRYQFVNEPISAWTTMSYVFLGCILMFVPFHTDPLNTKIYGSRVLFGISMVTVGFVSWWYHSDITAASSIGDFTGMVLCVGFGITCAVAKTYTIAIRDASVAVTSTFFYILFFSFFTVATLVRVLHDIKGIYDYSQYFVVIVYICTILLEFVHAIRNRGSFVWPINEAEFRTMDKRSSQTRMEDLDRRGRSKFGQRIVKTGYYLLLSMLFFALGGSFWLADQSTDVPCTRFHQSLHGIWHVCTAVGFSFLFCHYHV